MQCARNALQTELKFALNSTGKDSGMGSSDLKSIVI